MFVGGLILLSMCLSECGLFASQRIQVSMLIVLFDSMFKLTVYLVFLRNLVICDKAGN